jgi:apolipoprotein N-acyltransferase
LTTVLGHYGGLPWYIAWPAVGLLSFYMALYLAIFAVMAQRIYSWFPVVGSLLLVPALWVGLDWTRAMLFTGFPWMDLGYALYATPLLLQTADLFGHYGLTYLIVLINCALLLPLTDRGSFHRPVLIIISAVPVVMAGYYSINAYQNNGKLVKTEAEIRVGVVQGNVKQDVKWTDAHQLTTVEAYLQASSTLVQQDPLLSFIAWPETAMPFYPPNSGHTEALQSLAKRHRIPLLVGAPWYEIETGSRQISYFNSAFVVGREGRLGQRYNKSHLVPFGEYVPFGDLLFFLSPLVEAVSDFSPGTIDEPLRLGGARAGVLICFESVFPELSRKWVLADANLLVNLTNDAWYGKSSAPHHSLAMAVLRAVESRRALVRSANTGISAFIMPSGEVTQRSGLFLPWSASETVPLLTGETFWVKGGYLFAPLCLGLAVVCGVMTLVAGRRQEKKMRREHFYS